MAESVLVTPTTSGGGSAQWRNRGATGHLGHPAHYNASSSRRSGGGNAADDRSTSSSTDSYSSASLRRDGASSRLEPHRSGPHMHQSSSQHHQAMMRHELTHPRGGSRHGRFGKLDSGGGGDALLGDYDIDALAVDLTDCALNEAAGSRLNSGYLQPMGGYPGSAPSTFYRESFLVERSGAGREGCGIGRSPVLSGISSLPKGLADDESLGPGNDESSGPSVLSSGLRSGLSSGASTTSPLMTGLTFSLDLAGFNTTGGRNRSFRVGGGNMSEGAESVHESDFLGFELALSDSGVMPSETQRGSGRFGGGGINDLGSSPTSVDGSVGGLEASSLPHHLDMDHTSFGNGFSSSAPTAMSSLFSFNSHSGSGGDDSGQAGGNDANEVSVFRRNR